MRGLSLVVARGGPSSSRCAGLSLSRPLLLWSTGSRRAGSVVVAHGAQLLRGTWDLPRPGLEPVSPALAGRLSTTAPPGKPTSFLRYGKMRPTGERAPMELCQHGGFVLTQEDAGILLLHWAYCLAGRKYTGLLREKWSFCSKSLPPMALRWFVKLHFRLYSLLLGVTPGVTAL